MMHVNHLFSSPGHNFGGHHGKPAGEPLVLIFTVSDAVSSIDPDLARRTLETPRPAGAASGVTTS